MLLEDYTPFCGEGTVVLLDTGDEIHAVRVGVANQVGVAKVLMLCRDVVQFEVVFNTVTWALDGPRATCPDCDGAKCAGCRNRGWVPLDARPGLQVLTATEGRVTVTNFEVTVGRDGPRTGKADQLENMAGPILVAMRRWAAEEKTPMRLATMLRVWEEMAMGEVLR